MSELKELSGEEFARRGNALFEERVWPQIEDPERDAHKFVAIDLQSGDYEVNESDVEAMDRLAKRRPEAEGRMFLRRVGSESAYHLGGRFRLEGEGAL